MAALRAFTSTGRVVAVVGAVAWLVGTRLGWEELLLVAGGCVTVLVAALLMTLGRADVRIALTLEPQRVVVGEDAVGHVAVTNVGSHRTLGMRLEAPVGAGTATFDTPGLAAGETWEELFVIPATRRGIVPVGPVQSVRGDPLGLARRPLAWAERIDLYVHPRTIRLPGLTVGWLRDLEGRPTNDLSPSDVAFHTLREYVPGDDRRHVHWRTSARLGNLMVRQFVDTRRSHLGLVLSTNRADYTDEDAFELAVSVVGSLGLGALFEDQVVTLTTGPRALASHAPSRLLDSLAGVEAAQRPVPLTTTTRHAAPLVRGASVVALVTGGGISPAGLRAAADAFHHDVRVVGVRAVPGTELSFRTVGSLSLLDVGSLEDLPQVVRATVSR